ncbi:CHAT domain-containing protein [Leptospira sp. 96542]|nr:CHAT domain-containing protein [Leptospira sp. 96542]
MKLRVLAKNNTQSVLEGECYWDTNLHSSVEIVFKFSGSTLFAFLDEWNVFVRRILSNPCSKSEFYEKLSKKSETLEQIIFGNAEPFWRLPGFPKTIQISHDPEFSAVPWEILKTADGFLFENIEFSRVLRIDTKPYKQSISKQNFLIVANPQLEHLANSVYEECATLTDLIQNKFPLKVLKKSNVSKIRMIEEITQAKYLHYVGHTEKQGIPFTKNDFLTTEEISNQNHSNLDLVFVNSCYSSFDDRNQFGITSSFLKAGAKEVIGFLFPVETTLAKKMGIEFWNHYLKKKNSKKIIFKIKSQLFAGTSSEIITAIGMIHFTKNEKKDSKKHFLGIFLMLIISFIILYFSTNNKNTAAKHVEEDSSPETIVKPIEKKRILDPLLERVRAIQDPEFRKEAILFLKSKHEFLDDSHKRELLNSILDSNTTEDRMFYEFRSRRGF